MANQRWSAEKNIEFITEYQRNECLWDPAHPLYKNREAREAGYTAIMEAMEMANMRDVIAKIRVLRNTYNNEITRMKKRKINQAGSGTKEEYVSKIPWLPYLDFLKNIDCGMRENSDCMVTVIKEEPSDSASESSQPFTTTATAAAVAKAAPPPPPPQLPKKSTKIEDSVHQAVVALEKVATQTFLNNVTHDEFDLFGQTIAQQLRQMPLETALETEEMVLATVRKQRIKATKTDFKGALSSEATASTSGHNYADAESDY